MLHMLPNKAEAEHMFTDLRSWLDEDEVLFLPKRSAHPLQYREALHKGLMGMGTDTATDKRFLWISYAEALAEGIPHQKTLREQSITLRTGQHLRTTQLHEQLTEKGYERSEFVYEPGQFAVRGGIIDLFSFAQSYPCRMEMMGKEVRELRLFDPETQLSVKKIDTLPIVEKERPSPNHNVEYLPLLSFLDKKTLVIVKDAQHTLENLKRFATQLNPTVWSETIQEHTCIEWSSRKFLAEATSFPYTIAPQPTFKKKFDWIAQDLLKHQEKDYDIYIATRSEEQITRLQDIFEQIAPQLHFKHLPIDLHQGFVHKESQLVIYTDHQLFDRFFQPTLYKKTSSGKGITSFKALSELNVGDPVVHADYGVANFGGLHTFDQYGYKQEAVRLIFKDNDLVYVGVHALHKISPYRGQKGVKPSLSKLGSKDWNHKKGRTKQKIRERLKELMKLYAQRKNTSGYAHAKDNITQVELESSFLYQDTPDQARATKEIKADMEQPVPMDRLLCGDVGFGKTEVALRAAFKCVCSGKQVALLVPTTVLALQHQYTFAARLENFAAEVDYITRFRSDKEVRLLKERVRKGQTDILIGTQRLLRHDITFKDLGLLIIDEEQKFGVKTKEKLKEKKLNIDTLTLTATPIPRTMHFSLSGIRDMSLLTTPPPNRQAVCTELHLFDKELLRKALYFELKRKGQSYFIHHRVKDINQMAHMLHELVPEARISLAHGQMEGRQLEQNMQKFVQHKCDILVSTNIVENGLDIANANTLILNQAHLFGLSDIHQMRGRVGRSNRKAFCYLLCPPPSVLTQEAQERLAAIEGFSNLGDGFKIALKDLEIRGTGNLLGAAQSGFMEGMGFETYHQLLDETVQELKENTTEQTSPTTTTSPFAHTKRCVVETDQDTRLPENYIPQSAERMKIYTRIARLTAEKELKQLQHELKDRFGPLPKETDSLWNNVRLRWKAEHAGFEKLVWKDQEVKMYFPINNTTFLPSETFERMMDFVQKYTRRKCRLIERKEQGYLWMGEASTWEQVMSYLEELSDQKTK